MYGAPRRLDCRYRFPVIMAPQSYDAKILSVYGLNLDRIVAITSTDSKEVDQWVDKMFNEVVDGKKYYSPTNKSLEEALHRVRCFDMTNSDPQQPVTRWKGDSHAHLEQIQMHFSDEQEGRM